jgi:hypothetical protein
VVLSATGVGLVAGCSNTSSSGSSGSSAGGGKAAAPQAAAGSGGNSNGSAAGPNGTAGSASGASGGTSKPNVADTSNLIITAGLQLSSKNPEQAAAGAEQTVTSAGGYVAAEAEGVGQQSLPTANATADASENEITGVSPVQLPSVLAEPGSDEVLLLLRIPPAHLNAVLSALDGTGTVSYRSLSETDVTGQVADVTSRISSAQASLTELRGMIDKAASMNDLISLETALASRESDLESLEAQQRALADEVQYATVTLGYVTPVPAAKKVQAKPATQHTGFVAGLLDGWHAFLAVLHVLLVVLGWLLPFAALVALLWWPVRRLARRRARGADGPGTRTWWRRGPEHRTE